MGVQDLRRVASVLEEVITEFGRRLIEDPRRLKGLLTDTLGSDASALREAIEAVVAAAEAGIPQHALEGVDREEMISTLEGLLADPASASEVVDIWMSALRVQDQTPTDGATVPAPFGIADVNPDLDPTELPPASADDEATLLPKAGAPMSPPADRPGLKGRVTALAGQRKVAVASVAGLLVLALGGIGAASMFDNAPATPPTTEAPATTATSGATTTTALPLTELEHKEDMSWGVTVDRRWELVGDQLFMSVAIESGGEAVGGYVWEFFPESLGQDASALADRLYPDTQQTETSLALDIPDVVTAV